MANDFLTGLSTNVAAVKMRKRRLRVKIEAMVAYGPESRAECHRCGDTDPENLALECTSERMREIKRREGISGGPKLYALLKAAGYPKGFRVTCKSCQGHDANYGKRRNPFLVEDSDVE